MTVIGSWGVGSKMIRTHFMMLQIVHSSELVLTAWKMVGLIKSTWRIDGNQISVIYQGNIDFKNIRFDCYID